MKISVIASGSNGNSCLVEDKNTSVLIDAGKSGREIESRMERLGKDIDNVDGILLTHGHHDHISGAGVISRRFNIPVYMTKQTFSEAGFKLGNIKSKVFSIDRSFKVKNFRIKPVLTSHSVSSCGFIIGKFGLFTDTGAITKEIECSITKLKGVLLESNHDIDMVINGPYPAFLKNWILSDEGHLSNVRASSLIQKKGKNLSLALLGHLSGNNNTPQVALQAYEKLVKRKIEYAVCSRGNESGSWEL
jgi:phosphoribosyl 1,2-cyclic phosphodiesterase